MTSLRERGAPVTAGIKRLQARCLSDDQKNAADELLTRLWNGASSPGRRAAAHRARGCCHAMCASEPKEDRMNITRRTAFATAAAGGLTLIAGIKAAQAAPHPKIEEAIHALEEAKADMEHAAHDFGGHRVDALHACDEAIKQLRLALQYADK
jgi:hypothetical protein